jgi:hypothetical protein
MTMGIWTDRWWRKPDEHREPGANIFRAIKKIIGMEALPE